MSQETIELSSDSDSNQKEERKKPRKISEKSKKKRLVYDDSDSEEINNIKGKSHRKRKLSDESDSVKKSTIKDKATKAKRKKVSEMNADDVSQETKAKKKVKSAKDTKKTKKAHLNEREKSPIVLSDGSCGSDEVEIMSKDQKAFSDAEWLANMNNISLLVANKILKLFKDENTVPFIARYRKSEVNNMSPDMLRSIKNSFDELLALRKRAKSVIKTLLGAGKLTPTVKHALENAYTLDEIEHIYTPLRTAEKKLLAEKAKAAGLEQPAIDILSGNSAVNLELYTEKLALSEVKEGICHIVGYVIAHDTETLVFLRKLRSQTNITIQTKERQAAKENKSDTKKTTHKFEKCNKKQKYSLYFDFSIPLKYIKPHQVLAINRGENEKILSVKVVIPDWFFRQFRDFCTNKWLETGIKDSTRTLIFEEGVKEAYARFIQPLMIRQIRAEMKATAEKESIEVFATNLKKLLLTPPCKGRPIIGIDPGYTHGCKVALVSETGAVIETGVIYPTVKKEHHNKSDDAYFLKNLLENYKCRIIALGNGTGCRETEEWIEKLTKEEIIPDDIICTIVDESGASIYSCSEEAQREFKNLDTNIISAISLARRLQDPLSELVKVDPKNIGVGMYQHDLKDKALTSSLDEVVTECVSFVGVDINTASHCLLRRIAGLNTLRATNILSYREKKGLFHNREELKKVKGIGDKVFEQCAGFLRVCPITDSYEEFYSSSNGTPLDRTWIHPESYETAKRFIAKCKIHNMLQIGTTEFIEKVKKISESIPIEQLAKELNSKPSEIQLIIDALTKTMDYDCRIENKQRTLFKREIRNISDLKEGTIVTGRVNNVTQFGAFVDIGVKTNGLIHISKSKGITLGCGDHVEVKVCNIEIERQRISLELISVLSN